MSDEAFSRGGVIPIDKPLSGYLRVIEVLQPDGTVKEIRERVLSREEVKRMAEPFFRVSQSESDTDTH